MGVVRIFVVQERLARIVRVLYYMERRFTRIQKRQYRQLRRLCCESLIRSVFTPPEPLLSASYLLHDLLLQR